MPPVILRHAFIPPDNARLAHLCGSARRAPARRSRRRSASSISRRHESFRIEGPKAKARARGRAAAVAVRARAAGRSRRSSCSSRWSRRAAGDAAAAAPPRRRPNDHAAHAPRRPGRAHAEPAALPAQHPQPRHHASASARPAPARPFSRSPARSMRSSAARCSASILTRPAVEAGERLGFLPGDLAQKVDPYLRPLYDALYDLMGLERVAKAFEKGTLEIAPLAFMRGRTLNHAFVILDEAQNTTPEQMKMFLTRIGFGTKRVVTGDVSQIDLPRGSEQRADRRRARAAPGPRHRDDALHLGRRGAPPAGRAHRRGLRRARAAMPERRVPRGRRCACRCSSPTRPTARCCRATRSRAGSARRSTRRPRSRCASSAPTKGGR